MIYLTILISAFFSFAFTGSETEVIKNEAVKMEKTSSKTTFNNLHKLEDIVIKEPYNLELAIKKGKNNSLDLIINIELQRGAFFASPFDNEHLKGYFRISLGEENNLSLTDLLTETPVSKAIIDEYSNRPTRWVKQNTTYVQNLKLNTEENFEVLGKLKFVIEPQCTMEEIPFKISVKNGEIEVQRNPGC